MPKNKTIVPSDLELNYFWEDMQDVLDFNGFNLDLNSQNDVCRLRITNIDRIYVESASNLNAFDSADVSGKFALIDDENLDISEATDNEIVSHMVPGKPSREKLIELYNAAVEGRLFAASLSERGALPRQIIVNSIGQVDCLPDMAHPTDDMIKATPCPIKPTKPKLSSAGFVNRIKAFFGNVDAQRICRKVDSDNAMSMRKYKKLKEDYNASMRMNQRFVKQCHNQMFSFACYFNKAADEDTLLRERRFMTMAEKAHFEPKIDAVCARFNGSIMRSTIKLTDLAKSGAKLKNNEDIKKSIATIVVQKGLENQMRNDVKNFEMTGAKFEAYTERANAIDEHIEALCQNKKFLAALEKLDENIIKEFATEPEKAKEDLVNSMTTSLAEEQKEEVKEELIDTSSNKELEDVQKVEATENEIKTSSKDEDIIISVK